MASALQGLDTTTMQGVAASTARAEKLARAQHAGAMNMAKIDKTAQEFEAQFIAQMLENMFSTVETNPVLGGGEGEEMYRSLMVDEYGKLLARSGGIGVADHVKREMLRLQEATHIGKGA